MKPSLAWLALCVLALAACGPGFGGQGVPRARTPGAAAPTPTEAFPPRPTPVYTPAAFPSCEPDTVPGFDSGSLPAPLVTSGPSAEDTLRARAARRGLLIGAAADPADFTDPAYTTLLARQFNLLAPENALRWDVVHPEPQRYDFSRADALAVFAQANGMALYGHALVWDQGLPQWLAGGDFSRDEWIQILCRHVKTLAARYRGRVYAWNVVNEPFQNSGQLRRSVWLNAIGPEYIAMAFQWAHEADPDALLMLNEHSAEGLNEKSQAVYALAEGLLRQGIPIDGIGLEMHVWLWGPPTSDELLANMRRLARLGLQAHITGMDVRTQYVQDSQKAKLAAQADAYRQALAACMTAPNCNVFITWGLTDRYSWIPELTGTPDAPLLFDDAGAPKPAYDALLDVLK